MAEVIDEVVKMARPGEGWTAPGNRRQSAPKLASQEKWAKENSVFIFNVGPWPQYIRRGSFCYDVAPCAADEKVSKPVSIRGIVTEDYPENERAMKLLQYDGKTFALDLIGIGIGIPHHEKLSRFGVFVSETNPPSEEEIRIANEMLDRECNGMVNDMNVAYAEGPKVARETYQAKYHNAAATRLGKTKAECPWMGTDLAKISDHMACPFCGESMGAKLPKCPNCKEIVNQAAYKVAQSLARASMQESA